jgi:hypothetical protein
MADWNTCLLSAKGTRQNPTLAPQAAGGMHKRAREAVRGDLGRVERHDYDADEGGGCPSEEGVEASGAGRGKGCLPAGEDEYRGDRALGRE